MPSNKCKVLLVIILPMIVGIFNIGFCQTQFNTMTSSLTNRIGSSFTQIDAGIIYQENLSPNDSQNHSIYLQEKSVLSLCVKVIQQDSQLESKIVGNVTKISPWLFHHSLRMFMDTFITF
jgi:hypothetical protein